MPLEGNKSLPTENHGTKEARCKEEEEKANKWEKSTTLLIMGKSPVYLPLDTFILTGKLCWST